MASNVLISKSAVQRNLIGLANGMCLASCYIVAKILHDEPKIDNGDVDSFILHSLITAVAKEKVAYDGTVLDANYLTGGRVEKSPFDSLVMTKSRADFAAVNYVYGGHNHWILWQRRGVKWDTVFDSMGIGESQCVAKGKPTDVRFVYY